MREKIENLGTFLFHLTEGEIAAVGRELLLENYPMALISADDLTVLHQTESSRYVLNENDFYSLEAYLPEEICDELYRCIRKKTAVRTSVELLEQRWTLCAEPTKEGALLIFLPERERQVGITSSLRSLLDTANHLLETADELEKTTPDAAHQVRFEAMRTLRQTIRLQLLWGAQRANSFRRVTPGAIVQRVAKRLALLDVGLWTEIDPRCSVEEIIVDEPLVQHALGALICNSVKYGGSEVRIALRVTRNRRGVVFTVEDDGPGLSFEAYTRMNNTWRQQDARSGGWGLSVPFVREIAAIHNGSLLYDSPTRKPGCTARIFLPCSQDDYVVRILMHQGMKIIDSPLSPIDIEMSGVLKESAYQKLEPEPFHQNLD